MQMNSKRKVALARLRRDLLEWERSDIGSIAAKPLENNIFEWHVNICPNELR